MIRISARETDIVARFGGDEFALVLPETGSEGAEMVGARIRDKIAAHPFLRKDGLDIKLSVSVGVATLPDVATTAEQLVKAADEAMYWVKEHGKNNVHVAHPTDETCPECHERQDGEDGGARLDIRVRSATGPGVIVAFPALFGIQHCVTEVVI